MRIRHDEKILKLYDDMAPSKLLGRRCYSGLDTWEGRMILIFPPEKGMGVVFEGKMPVGKHTGR